ncbi:cell division protein FtsB [Buchnera aphidicola (Muscaphis stroyani)]|uniref:Cell division protein FtsB n=1 Tax=Buchnera aphidicola (Muscaphis stroyani) TaxID=1241869 RepID=A0A4D6Y5P3_9GAMM|nr:septum formation initiator family protein [Buchnera aphidicola]QCI24469.1 cell division protein FtsB [Buchnera aphidicola (Muscaphis stroyani)]
MKILKTFLFFIFLWLQYSLWFSKNGIFDYIRIYKIVISEEKYNNDLQIQNNKLIIEIKNLNNKINGIKKNKSN